MSERLDFGDAENEQPQSSSSSETTASEAASNQANMSVQPLSTNQLLPRQRWQAAFLLLCGIVVTVLGVWDLMGAEELNARLSGAILGAIGALILGSVLGLNEKSKLAPLAVSVAAFSLFLVALVIFRLAWANYDMELGSESQTRLLAVTIISTAVALIAAGLVVIDLWSLNRHPEHWRSRKGKQNTGSESKANRATFIGAVAAVLTPLIVLPQLWYSTQYLPSTKVPVISINGRLRDIQLQSDRATVTADITLTNTGEAPVRVLFSMYEITGSAVKPDTPMSDLPPGHLDTKRLSQATVEDFGPSARYGTYVEYGQAQLIQFGQIVQDQAWLEPKEFTRATVVAFLPPERFHLLRLTTDIAFVRQDRLRLGERISEEKDCENLRVRMATWPVIYGSALERLTNSEAEVSTALVIGVLPPVSEDTIWWPNVPGLHASIHHTGKPCDHILRDEEGGLEERAMFGRAGSVTDMAIALRS